MKNGFFRVDRKAKDANDHIIYNEKTGTLIYYANGNAAGGVVTMAKLQKCRLLAEANFLIV